VSIYRDLIKWAEKRGEVEEHPLEPEESPAVAHHPLAAEMPRPLANDLQVLQENTTALRSQQDFRSVLVASAVWGEGVSTVAANWSRLMARDRMVGLPVDTTDAIGGGVLLIDANLRRPVLHRLFELDRKQGLTELLQGELELEQVLKSAPRRNLWVITAGKPAANPADLLGSLLMKGILDECRRRFEFIVLDSAPITQHAETLALAKQVDAVVMVVHSGKTRWEVALSAKNQVLKVNPRILGVVMNQRQFIIPEWIYRRI